MNVVPIPLEVPFAAVATGDAAEAPNRDASGAEAIALGRRLLAPRPLDEGQSPSFGAWAELYWRFRPIYPAAVFDLLNALTKGQSKLCVELGAGSGQATVCLLDRFAEVIAVEPDAAMAGLLPKAARLTPVIATAEAYAGPPSPADAVVAASSFHWMEQHTITRRAAQWLRPGGVFFAFSYGAVQYPSLGGAAMRVLHRHAQRSKAHVDPRLVDFAPYAEAIEADGDYRHIDTFELYVEHSWAPRALAGFLMSTSYGHAMAIATGDANGYFETLAHELDSANQGRAVSVRFPIAGAFGLRV